MNAFDQRDDQHAATKALLALSRVDLLFADLYFERAEAFLSSRLSRREYRDLVSGKAQLPQVTNDLRSAAEKGEWARVRELAGRARHLRGRIAERTDVLTVAGAVYGPRIVQADTTTLGIRGLVDESAAKLTRAKASAISHLRLLESGDPERRGFYRNRIEYFEGLQIDTGDEASPTLSPGELRKRVLEAADRGDFDRIRELTQTVPDETPTGSARVRAQLPAEDHAHRLSDPFPDDALDAARDLGLCSEILPSNDGLNAFMSCSCAEQTKLRETHPSEAVQDASQCTCGQQCPPNVTPRLREKLDFVLEHLFITSGGNRYLPWFGTEALLVETFSEEEPDARTPLQERLRLDHRHRAPRVSIDDALLTQGPSIVAEIGLDPFEFRLSCIPFDAYLRLGPKHGWGQRELWTHFDGYLVTRQRELWGMVGGHSRFGGLEDQCSLNRYYKSDLLTARFAVVRRRRFLVREQPHAESIPQLHRTAP